MSTYTRSTRECTLKDLSTELSIAIQKHIETLALENIDSSPLICCETTSTQKKTSLFTNKNENMVTGMLVTPQYLVWTEEKEKGEPIVTSALLRNIDAHDFENTAMYKVKPDSGINISGRYTDVTRQGQTFIGLGTDSAGEKFRQVLQHAIQKAKS